VLVVRRFGSPAIGGSRGRDDIVPFEQPVDVLEPVLVDVGMVQQDAADAPVLQVFAAHQGQRVADASGVGILVPRQDRVRERPVELRDRVEANRELLGPAGEVDESGLGVEGGGLSVLADLDDRGLSAFGLGVHAQDVDDAPVGRHDGVAFEPAAERVVEPRRIATDAVADDPILGVQQVGVGRHGHHEGVEVPAPATGAHRVLHGPPESAFVEDHRHRGAVILTSIDQDAGELVPGLCPGAASIGRASDHHVAMVLAGAHEIQRAFVGEHAGPIHVLHDRPARP